LVDPNEIRGVYAEIRARVSAKMQRPAELVERVGNGGLVTWWYGRFWARPEAVAKGEMLVVFGHDDEEMSRRRGFRNVADIARGMAAALSGSDIG
jgi:hypothetical protein